VLLPASEERAESSLYNTHTLLDMITAYFWYGDTP